MPLSRERAVDLSHRILDRLARTPGVAVGGEREFVRNRVLQLLLEWDRESDKLEDEARRRVATRGKRIPEGSREWDLLFGEELEKLYLELIARGE